MVLVLLNGMAHDEGHSSMEVTFNLNMEMVDHLVAIEHLEPLLSCRYLLHSLHLYLCM
jgi:hypothetical protein